MNEIRSQASDKRQYFSYQLFHVIAKSTAYLTETESQTDDNNEFHLYPCF